MSLTYGSYYVRLSYLSGPLYDENLIGIRSYMIRYVVSYFSP